MPEAACNCVVSPTEVDSNLACLFQPWKGEKSPAFHAARSPGELKSQSGRISHVTAQIQPSMLFFQPC
jgi:hypothetical protein